VIDRNATSNGWLIFATHDVTEHHTPYGCTPEFFSEVVRCSIDSGARILPVADACQMIVEGVGEGVLGTLMKVLFLYRGVHKPLLQEVSAHV